MIATEKPYTSFLESIKTAILDFLTPNCCVVCGNILQQEIQREDDKHKISLAFLCKKCQKKAKYINQNSCCKTCGYPLKKMNFLDKNITTCISCEKYHVYFDKAYSCYEYYGVIKKLLLLLKYNFSNNALSFFGESLYKLYKKKIKKADIICFVPSTKWKLFYKGFNPAGIFTNCLKNSIKKYEDEMPKIYYDLILKNKKTKQSKSMNQIQRLYKKHYFSINEKYQSLIEKNKNTNIKILIIDDIMTTGGTMNAMSYVLKKHFKKANISCLTFARTMLY